MDKEMEDRHSRDEPGPSIQPAHPMEDVSVASPHSHHLSDYDEGSPSVMNWTQREIRAWLAEENLVHVAPSLEQITRGSELLALTRDELHALPLRDQLVGLPPLITRLPAQLDRLWSALQRLRVRHGAEIRRHLSLPSSPAFETTLPAQPPPSEPHRLVEACNRFRSEYPRVTSCCRQAVIIVLAVLVFLGFQYRPSEWHHLGKIRLEVEDKESAFKGEIYALDGKEPLYFPVSTSGPKAYVSVRVFIPPVMLELASMEGNTTAQNEEGEVKLNIDVQAWNTPDQRWYNVHPEENDLSLRLRHMKVTTGRKRMKALTSDVEGDKVRIRARLSEKRLNGVLLTIPMKMKITTHPSAVVVGPLLGFFILIFMYTLIIFEVVPKVIAAMASSFLVLSLYSYLHERPELEEVISWIDFETICLLFGMMIMVGMLAGTGLFEWAAVQAYRMSAGSTWRLVMTLSFFVAFVSAFLDNVTTVLLLAPVTIRLCNVLRIPPQLVLICEVIFSNLGGTVTPIGDPPNVIIANNRDIADSGVTFFSFTISMLIGVLLACVASALLLKRLVREKLIAASPVLEGLQNEMGKYKRELARLCDDRTHHKAWLLQRIAEIEHEIHATKAELASGGVQVLPSPYDLAGQYKIKDHMLFIQCAGVLLMVVLLFFLHSAVQLKLPLAMISLYGAILLIALTGKHDLEPILEKVEWQTLLFFAALFVLMKGLEKLELIEVIANATASAIGVVPKWSQTTVAVILVLWVSAIVSAFIDNIPFTAAMVPVIVRLAQDTDMNVSLHPLVYALSFGTCFGGNGTLIGASANVVVAGLAEQRGHPITFGDFFKVGFPVMLLSTSVACVYLIILSVI